MTVLPSTTLATGAYRSYLVRFWQSNEQGDWRASAQCVQSGSTLLFGDVESLLAFLQQEFVKKRADSPSLSQQQSLAGTS
ncbi:MAG: hypothetical protein R3E79_46855 [Caldilineaceae bacterium]